MKFSTSRYRDISNRFLDEKNDIFYIKDNISYIKYIKTNFRIYTCRAQCLISKNEFNIYNLAFMKISSEMDYMIHTFKRQKELINYNDYLRKNVKIFTDHQKICNDVRNIVLSFLVINVI